MSLTPLELGSSMDVTKSISLVNDDRSNHKRLLEVNLPSNVWGAGSATCINIDANVLKHACVSKLKRGLPVFFGSDIGKQRHRWKDILGVNLVDCELWFDVKLDESKGGRLYTGDSQVNHAIVRTPVHLGEAGSPVRWRVENSRSEAFGTKGYEVMSNQRIIVYCYQAVVGTSVVDKSVRDVLKQEPKVLPLWGPMGALAFSG